MDFERDIEHQFQVMNATGGFADKPLYTGVRPEFYSKDFQTIDAPTMVAAGSTFFAPGMQIPMSSAFIR